MGGKYILIIRRIMAQYINESFLPTWMQVKFKSINPIEFFAVSAVKPTKIIKIWCSHELVCNRSYSLPCFFKIQGSIPGPDSKPIQPDNKYC